LASKTRTSRQLNLYKALTILDQGVGASGVIAVNTQNMKSFSGDPNDRRARAAEEGLDATATEMSQFGKSLIDAMGAKARPSKLGTKQENEGF
jgi:hypothetical protein